MLLSRLSRFGGLERNPTVLPWRREKYDGAVKWRVLFLIWLMMVVAYFDRINLATAGASIMGDLHLNKAQLGLVLAAFTLGYALMQAPGGYLADRFGSKRLLIVAILVWSVFTALTGVALSLASMLAVRVVFGVGEGLENGAQFKLIGDHFEPKDRSLANALFLSALAVGPMLGTPIAAWLTLRFGWRPMFYSFALLGLLLAAVLGLLLPQDAAPDFHRDRAAHRENLRSAFGHPASWLCALAYLLFNMAFWGFLSWVPTYLREDRHMPLAKSGLVGALPYAAAFVGMLIVGRLGSTTLLRSRPLLVAGCYLVSGAGLVLALKAPNVSVCTVGLCIGAAFLFSAFGPQWAVAVDLAPSHARGVFTGSVNFCGQVGAFFSQIIIGYLANRMQSFDGAILFMAGALLVGAAAMVALQRVQSTHALQHS